MTSNRKTPKTWIEAGLEALKHLGPDGLRAETLSRAVGTTKGSFYWHFKDVPAFQDAVLATWAAQAEARFEKALEQGDTSVTRLRSLARVRPTPLDLAVRAWAVQDPRPRKVVARVDKTLLSTLSELLTDLEATHPDFPTLVHAAMMAGLRNGKHAETLVDLLLVLK